MSTKVVNLRQVRDLLAEWEKVRSAIAGGLVKGFHVALRDREQDETIYLGGVYRENPRLALGAILKASAARSQEEDEPPLFQASRM